MRSWKLLQMEPQALRQSNAFDDAHMAHLGRDGSRLAATLYRLQRENTTGGDIYQQLTNRLSDLVEGVKKLWIDKDEKRELLTLMMQERNGGTHPARSLSDGTLRFIGLSVLELDMTDNGLICMEEPENGIHPEKIPAILDLLQEIAADPANKEGPFSLRQVMINTHSPLVVQEVPEDTLLMLMPIEKIAPNQTRYKCVSFRALWKSWRVKKLKYLDINKGKLLSYLNPTMPKETPTLSTQNGGSRRRVVDNPIARQLMLPFLEEKEKE